MNDLEKLIITRTLGKLSFFLPSTINFVENYERIQKRLITDECIHNDIRAVAFSASNALLRSPSCDHSVASLILAMQEALIETRPETPPPPPPPSDWCPNIVILDGNVGAGKTTVLTNLVIDPDIKDRIHVVFEPVVQFKPDLDIYLKDRNTLAYWFQDRVCRAILENMAKEIEAARTKGAEVIIFERTVASCFMFAECQEWHNKRVRDTAFEMIKEHFEKQTKMFKSLGNPTIEHVYLYVPPEECLQRIKARGRGKEPDAYDLSYLRKLDAAHSSAQFINWTRKDRYEIVNCSGTDRLTGEIKNADACGELKEFIINRALQHSKSEQLPQSQLPTKE